MTTLDRAITRVLDTKGHADEHDEALRELADLWAAQSPAARRRLPADPSGLPPDAAALADIIHDATPAEDDGGVPNVCNRWPEHLRVAEAVLAALPAIEAEAQGDVAALTRTFPLDLEAFIAGLDNPHHSPESRRAWIALFFRDMHRSRWSTSAARAALRATDTEGSNPDA